MHHPTLYLLTYNSTSVTKRRSAESAATADWTAYRLLQPHQWQVDAASAVLQELFDPYAHLWFRSYSVSLFGVMEGFR